MLDGAYSPRWVTVDTAAGAVRAIAFTIDRTHLRYAGNVDESELVRIIATAAGKMGRCSDYLLKTVEALTAAGIRDDDLERLNARVQAMLVGPRDAAAHSGLPRS